MSVSSTLYTGVSGLTSNGQALATVGDNIANASTVGYKGSRHVFADVLAQSLQSDTGPIGQGSTSAEVQLLTEQGTLQGTGVATDLAVQGEGFFVVQGSSAGMSGTFYTRAGQFHWDELGQLANKDGLAVQGYNVDASGMLVSKVEALQIAVGQVPPAATSSVSLAANLDANEAAMTVPLSLTDPSGTSNLTTSVTVNDSLGQEHDALLAFRKQAPGMWSWTALVDGAEINGGTPGTYVPCATGSLIFDNQGKLQLEALNFSSFSFVDAAPGQSISFDFGDSVITDAGTGLQGVTSFAAASTVSGLERDGYAAGSMTSALIEADGTVRGIFDNGQQRAVGQVLLASFQAPDQLQRIGSNLFLESQGSGQAVVEQAGSGGRGVIAAGSLERSNVDLSRQFVDMIAFQRGFQASSKTITTTDQLLQELLQLKR
jgi:flagellar hook protein FlgE